MELKMMRALLKTTLLTPIYQLRSQEWNLRMNAQNQDLALKKKRSGIPQGPPLRVQVLIFPGPQECPARLQE